VNQPERPAVEYVCTACGATMKTWQEFPEYQHDGCGGLVRLRLEIELDDLRAEVKRLRGIEAVERVSQMLSLGEPVRPDIHTRVVRERDALRAEVERLRQIASTFDKRCGDRLADEVDVLVCRKVIDSRSPAADALLDYRNPPTSERSERLTVIEAERDALRARLARVEPIVAAAEVWREGRDRDVDAHGEPRSASGKALIDAIDAARAKEGKP
jgi:hypothetical protein